jgi:carbonic anhydrase
MNRLHTRIVATIAAAGLAGSAACAWGADGAKWSYSGATGPANWGKLDKDFAACAKGEMQAPIDIPDAKVRKGDLPPLLFNYQPAPLSILDDGRSIQVNYAPGSFMTVEGKRYQLAAIEFHKPGEVKVGGKAPEMAAHFLHKDKDGKLAVLVVPFAAGAEHPLLKTLWSSLPAAKGKESVLDTVKINATALLPTKKDYYAFAGSLSTPPCTENVAWYVLKTPVLASPEQIARLGKVNPPNARPTQPLNDRDIVGSP